MGVRLKAALTANRVFLNRRGLEEGRRSSLPRLLVAVSRDEADERDNCCADEGERGEVRDNLRHGGIPGSRGIGLCRKTGALQHRNSPP
jgi:hypothetical protein